MLSDQLLDTRSGGAAKASLDSLREQAFVCAEGICETMSGSEAPKGYPARGAFCAATTTTLFGDLGLARSHEESG